MDILHPVLIQFATLLRGPLDTQQAGVLVRLTLHDLPCQRLRDVAVEGLGHHCQLTQFRHRLDARDDGDGDTHLPRFLHKLEVFLVVEEQLGHGILRPQILLLLQILHVHLQVGRLLVLLGITRHTIVERLARPLDGRAVGKETLVEALHLPDQVGGMRMSARCGHETAVLLRLVATQQQQVADAQELQVEQFILDVLDGTAATDHVGLHRDVVPLLDGGCNGHRTRATADALPLKLPVLQFLIHKLRMVGRDIDVGWVEFAQFVDVGKQLVGACTLQWGKHLEREPSFVLILMDKFRYTHNWLQNYE